MKSNQSAHAAKEHIRAPPKIVGFDEISRRGLPHTRAVLLFGEPHSGKTITALQVQAPAS